MKTWAEISAALAALDTGDMIGAQHTDGSLETFDASMLDLLTGVESIRQIFSMETGEILYFAD